jgi:HlyD family secretion protein
MNRRSMKPHYLSHLWERSDAVAAGRGAVHPVIRFAIGVALLLPLTIRSASADGIEVQDCAVRFAAEVQIPALTTGRVAEVTVAPNDTVELGDPIARLDDRSLLIRRRAAQLRYDNAKAESIDHVEIDYARVAKAEAEAELDVNRSIQNDARGAVPMTRMRQLRLAVERGQLEVAQAKKRLKQAEVEAGLREADLAVIDDQLRNLHVESPIGGVVLAVDREQGEWIEKGQPITTVGRIDRLHVNALLSSDKIAPSQCRGLSVSVHWIDPADGKEKSLRGTVLSVDPQMLPGGRFRLHAEIVNRNVNNEPDQWQLHPGAEVRMKVFPTTVSARNSNAIGTRR